MIQKNNPWNIPDDLVRAVRARDKRCVYCGIPMKAHAHSRGTPNDKATWEHIDNDENNLNSWNICLCCGGCNKSKGNRKLSAWLKSEYCARKNINAENVAPIIKEFLQRHK